MKISVLADCHLGAGHNTALESDPFDNLEEALEKSKDCDLILIAGDLFDSRSPRTTVWARAISLLNKPLMWKSGMKVVGSTKKFKEIHERTLNSVPVLCLHGNHDRRMRGETNVVQALDSAGLLLHLDKENIVFEKDGTKVAIHGMSSVPERYAKGVLNSWNPKPIYGCFNVLVIHQNVEPYVYSPLEPSNLEINDLPKGFDMILDGHIHTKITDKAGDSLFMILGSTVTTQFDKKEASSEKGFHKIIFEQDKKPEIEFVSLENNRKFFYHDIKVENQDEMRSEIDSILNDIVKKGLKKTPMVKFKISGKDIKLIDHDIAVLKRKYSDKVILSFVKQLESAEMTEKLEFMKNLREQKLSIEEIGLNLLRNNLEELKFSSSFNYEDVFRMLSDNELEKTVAVLTGDQKTLQGVMSR